MSATSAGASVIASSMEGTVDVGTAPVNAILGDDDEADPDVAKFEY